MVPAGPSPVRLRLSDQGGIDADEKYARPRRWLIGGRHRAGRRRTIDRGADRVRDV
jgi:hypothetical protein